MWSGKCYLYMYLSYSNKKLTLTLSENYHAKRNDMCQYACKKVETRDKVKENSKLDVNSRVPVAKLR